MKPIIPISLKRLAVRNMQSVQRGILSKPEAAKRLNRISREDAITHLTRNYDPECVEALMFFRLL